MAYTNKSPYLVTFLTVFFIAFFSSSENLNLPASTISAAPAILPDFISPPLSSPPPALSPDISPLFPSPAGPGLSPSESSMPLIPSSPSPPNPDAMVAPGPEMVYGPSGPMPYSFSARVHVPVCFSSVVVVFGAILVNAAL